MYGPEPKGFWTSRVGSAPYKHFEPGTRYRVVKEFTDYDGATHPVGETFWYAGYNYSAYDDGLSLFVSMTGDDEWHIRMSNYPGDQDAITAAFETYVVAV